MLYIVQSQQQSFARVSSERYTCAYDRNTIECVSVHCSLRRPNEIGVQFAVAAAFAHKQRSFATDFK